jgi:uncharacterized membrane protein YoaK (UPF0700 family)
MPIKTLQSLTHVERNAINNYQLGGVLSFVAGYINAGGFLAIGRYTSHMSGIISGVGDDLALSQWRSVLAGLSLLAAFILGSTCTSVMVNWGRRREIHARFALPLLVEALVIFAFGFMGSASLESSNLLTLPSIALVLCFVMGLQNAIITKISKAEIRTTHMTGVVTDIGIELGRLLYWNQSRSANEVHVVLANRQKLKAHLLILSMFLAGAILGALSFKGFGFWAAWPVASFLLLLSCVQIAKDLGAPI